MAYDLTDPAQLTRSLGGKWHRSYGAAPCPVCQPETRRDQNALTVAAGQGRLLLDCKKSGCAFTDILAAAGIAFGRIEIDRAAIERARRDREATDVKRRSQAQNLWDRSQSIVGTPGEVYLRARGITCRLPAAMRWLPETYHGPTAQAVSAIVAKVSSGGVHRTFFDASGRRLAVGAKMMLGPCQGGAVRLTECLGPLVVCEGLETGLSLACGLLSGPANIWATLSTSGMKGVRLPERPGKLTIATDGDPAGRTAGNALASRAAAIGWSVSLLPAPDKRDWNDILVGKGVAA